MADLNMWCKQCEKITGHTHLSGFIAICSDCGERNKMGNVKTIKAKIEIRKAEAVKSLERITGLKLDQNMRGRPECKIKKEGDDMAKLTQEIRSKIVSMRIDGQPAAVIADYLKVNVGDIYRVCKEEKRKARGGPAPAGVKVKADKLKGGQANHDLAFGKSSVAPLPQAGKPGLLKYAIAVEVASQMAVIRQQIKTMISDEVKELLK